MNPKNLDLAFNPKSIAVAGVSTSDLLSVGGFFGGRMFLDALLRYGYSGKIYPINPKGGEVSGLKVYTNLAEVPGPVDLVICSVPLQAVPQLVRDCVAKGVKAVSVFTSGFSETGSEEGKQLEREVCQIAQQGGVTLIGPNCMGVYCPKGGVTFAADFPRESGSVALVCQSGGNATHFVRIAARRGIRFSKVVAYGNACDVDESDLFEHLTTDPETKIIAAYIEGVKDGVRFLEVLKKAVAVKPVIILKAGYTEAGAKAAASHTGSLAGSSRVWDGVLKQAGVLRVYTLEELVDMVVAFLYLSPPAGRRAGIVGVSGGAAVLATDEFVANGFIIPPFPDDFRNKLRSFFPTDHGTSLRNPVDLGGQVFNPGVYPALASLANYEGVDFLIVQLSLGMLLLPPFIGEGTVLNSLADWVIRVHQETSKPLALVIHAMASGESWEVALDCQEKCYRAGLPVYNSISGVAKAIDRFIRYCQGHELIAPGQACFVRPA